VAITAAWRRPPAARRAHVHGTAAAASDGFAMAQRSALYTSVGQPGSVRAITTGVCYCCKTAIATANDGTIFAAWRNVYAGSIRDIAASVSRDGGRTFAAPVKVSDDGWALNGCPDDGPAMAIDGRGQVHIVWPTLVTGANGAQR
jgi:3-hydroxyisobutyrate dehydrogenase-like beta-hydroxyacid dehydrogenase